MQTANVDAPSGSWAKAGEKEIKRVWKAFRIKGRCSKVERAILQARERGGEGQLKTQVRKS